MSTQSARPATFLLLGSTDSTRCRVRWTGWDKRPQPVFEGTASFLTQMKDPPLALQTLQFGGPSFSMQARLPRLPCLNFMADADLYRRALRQAAALVQQIQAPCFNHPDAVRRNTRDDVATRLQGIPGLVVPRTVRAQADTVEQLKAAMEAAGIGFPLIVRLAGDHGGVSTALVRHDADWEALNPLGWGGRPVYLTQFVDYADADGHYRKVRLAVVGQQVFVRHCIVSASWLVHAKNRAPGGAVEEAAFMEAANRHTPQPLVALGLAVADRLQLDYFGMDVSLRPDGSALLFEANACMNILLQPKLSGEWQPMVVARIEAALRELLVHSGQWRSQTGALPGAVER